MYRNMDNYRKHIVRPESLYEKHMESKQKNVQKRDRF